MRQFSKKVECMGYTFDSVTEKDYYLLLLENKERAGIKEITVHPKYEIIPAHYYVCPLCYGTKTTISKKTGNDVQCPKCRGKGHIKHAASYYTPDFVIEYNHGGVKVVDVKGYANEGFPLRKKLFEAVHKKYVTVVKKDKHKGWVEK